MKNKIYFRKFGFELEFSTPFEDTLKIAKKAVNKVCGKNKIKVDTTFDNISKYRKWEFKYDGSTECELTTPISSINYFKKIEEVLKILGKNNLKITTKDSVHIHMQANDVPKHNIIAAWIQMEPIILKLFPKHRRNNYYCEKLIRYKKYNKISDFFIKAEEESIAHHAILSLGYYQERKTVEFRIMEGNLDINNIRPWVKFCMLFLNYAKTIDPVEVICKKEKSKINTSEMIELLKIEDEEVLVFLEKRRKRFRG